MVTSLPVDFTSLHEFRVDEEAAGGDITCRCCQVLLSALRMLKNWDQPGVSISGAGQKDCTLWR